MERQGTFCKREDHPQRREQPWVGAQPRNQLAQALDERAHAVKKPGKASMHSKTSARNRTSQHFARLSHRAPANFRKMPSKSRQQSTGRSSQWSSIQAQQSPSCPFRLSTRSSRTSSFYRPPCSCGRTRFRALGKAKVEIECNGQRPQDDLYIVDTTGPPLFGRTWLRQLRLDWSAIHSVRSTSVSDRLDKLKERYADIFKTDLGCLRGVQGSLNLVQDATPKFMKARPVPYALRPKIDVELERMEAEGIISPVSWSEWATPVVPVVKQNGNV